MERKKRLLLFLAVVVLQAMLFVGCGLLGDDKHEHTPTAISEKIEPTCTNSGLTEGSKCSECSELLQAQEIIPALGHSKVIDAGIEATCEKNGLTDGAHCSECDAVLAEQVVIPALGHTVVTDAEVTETCEAEGLTEGSHCSVCEKVFVAQEVIPALGHNTVTDIGWAAECESEGLTDGSHCSVCEKVLVAQEAIPAFGHNAATDIGWAATCESEGLTEGSHCSVCEKVLVAQEAIPALGHAYTSVEKKASCSDDGMIIHTCEYCADTYNSDFVNKSAHRFDGTGTCLMCGATAPTESMEPDVTWYTNTKMAFTLTTKEELAGLAELVNSGTDFSGKVIYLGADVDLGYYEWTPIGTKQYPFAAIFDGQGHTISSLKISKDMSYVGFFGNVSSEIYNFTIDNASIYVKGIQNYVAIACAYSTRNISDISVDGYIDAKLSSYVGGIAGYAKGQLINLLSVTDVNANVYAGGIAGYMQISSSHFENLKNYGAISAQGATSDVGGIVGKIESTGRLFVENCQNYGTVNGNSGTGGIFGSYQSSGSFNMNGCANYADVKGGDNTAGVIGYFYRNNTEDHAYINEFKNTGNVSGFNYVGGVFGYYWCVGKSNIRGAYNDGEILGNGKYVGGISGYSDYVGAHLVDFINNGTVSGNDYCGGIFGKIHPCESDLDIINFINNADVSGMNYVAGLIGYFESSVTPSITKSENNGNISGKEYVGGIAGYGSTQTLLLSELVNNGKISANGGYVGGIAAWIQSGSYITTVDQCQNFGDISGDHHVSGLFGLIKGKVGSLITNCVVACDINAQYTVGAIAAQADNLTISECINAGTTINATGSYPSGNLYYAYVGGIVGTGYRVEKCTNEVVINYINRGMYVGGIAGYLSHSVSECINVADINGYDYVGGIAGWVTACSVDAYTSLINSADVSGHDYVGGIVGKCEYKNNFILTDCENTGDVNGNSYVGGIIGSLNRNGNYTISISGLNNTGDIIASGGYSGGLFGYVYSYNVPVSVIENCSSSADVSGLYFVGGLIGKGVGMTLKNSTNAGSTVTATGFVVESNNNNAYLGGYIGFGDRVEGLINDVEIYYDQPGRFVGGIAGYLAHSASNCTNNANVTGGADYVGGISGWLTSPNADSSGLLINNGDISGKNFVAGIIGKCEYANVYSLTDSENNGNISGNSYVAGIIGSLCRTKNFDFTITNVKNTGDITASEGYVGGLFGYIYGYGESSIVTDSASSANVTGLHNVGGLIGKATDMKLKNSTNAGSTVTATGFIKDGDYNVVGLGGYIGVLNGSVEGLTNDVDIYYDQGGRWIGGIVGYIMDGMNCFILNCINNGDITSNGNCVGGICGSYYENCSGATHEIIGSLTNTGAIRGAEYVGGIFGAFRADGKTVKYLSTDFTNVGEISGSNEVGEICGIHYTTGASTLTGCTVLGHVTVNGEVVSDCDVGNNKNLTISDRTYYSAESEEE